MEWFYRILCFMAGGFCGVLAMALCFMAKQPDEPDEYEHPNKCKYFE